MRPALSLSLYPPRATPARLHAQCLGCSPFAHHYSGNLFDFSYLRLLRCFTSPSARPIKGAGTTPGRLPHSEIHGSTAACASPWLFAACYVLHRHLAPRHPPRALNTLTPSSSYNPKRGLCHCAYPKQARGDQRRTLVNFLLRKEVIQPHLPVRLPCYDFTPLTKHTLGTSSPRRLGR